ncbi:hypothetical protein LJC64_04410 [Ruminococcaceae bacterium OttesenSCG-928-A11]|nr:hypothetical protein [Ruminococcaceae bacterium OttesenSCG-928-A11]
MDSLTTISTTSTSMNDALDVAVLTTIGVGAIMAMILVVIGAYVLQSVFLMQLFKKAKVARWKAWVPVVNTWTFLQIGGQKGWWILAGLIGAAIGYFFFAAAGVTGVAGNTANIGISAMVGSFAAIGYLAMMAGLILTAVFDIIAAYNIGKKLGWSGSMVVVYIFFSIIWLGIAGLGKAKFNDKKGQPSLAKTA